MTMHSILKECRALPLDWLVTPALAFSHPNEVLVHPNLTDPERKAILASWASDAHAVEGMPWLRELENGATVRLTDVLDALRALDRTNAKPPNYKKQGRSLRRFGKIFSRRTGKEIAVEYRSCRP